MRERFRVWLVRTHVSQCQKILRHMLCLCTQSLCSGVPYLHHNHHNNYMYHIYLIVHFMMYMSPQLDLYNILYRGLVFTHLNKTRVTSKELFTKILFTYMCTNINVDGSVWISFFYICQFPKSYNWLRFKGYPYKSFNMIVCLHAEHRIRSTSTLYQCKVIRLMVTICITIISLWQLIW